MSEKCDIEHQKSKVVYETSLESPTGAAETFYQINVSQLELREDAVQPQEFTTEAPIFQPPTPIFVPTNKRSSRVKQCTIAFSLVALVFAGIIALVFALFWQKLLIGSGNAMLEEYSSKLPNATQTPNITLTNPFNMKELVYLPVIPEGATIDKKAVGSFNYTLSDDFLIKGEPNLQSIEVWADKVSIKAIRVTFDNGNTTETTKIYGISNTTALSKLTKSKKSFPSTLQIAGSNSNYLKSNTPLTQIGGAYFALYNFGVNQIYNIGLTDSSVPAIQALRVSTLDAIVAGQQHIVGVTGIYAKSSSELLGFNFILASKNDIIIDAARLCMRQYGFLIRDDLSILDPLDLGTKVDVYGYSAQARFGDNKTPKPDALDLIETVKWNNWNAKKGIDPQTAKLKWLSIVEPLIIKKGLPKCKW